MVRTTILALVLLLAACGAQSEPTPAGTDGTPDAGEALGALAYSYQPGQVLEYRVNLTQRLTATGTSSLTAADDDEADVTTIASGRVRYDVRDGPEDGLLEVSISGDFDSVETTGTFNGSPIDSPKDITPFAPEVEEPRRRIVIDRLGQPWRDGDGPSGLNPLWLLNPRFAAFDPLEDLLGPVFSSDEVSVGDSWSAMDTTYVTDQEVTTTFSFTIQSVEDTPTGTVATIAYTSVTSGFAVDFGDTVRDLLAFLGRGTDEAAGLSIIAAPGSGEGVIEFDLDQRTVLSQEAASVYSFDVDAAIPLEDFAEADIVLNGEITFTAERIDATAG